MLTYADAEAVLAKIYGAQTSQKTTFRAVLKHLRKLGVPLDCTPGRGQKILYGCDELYQWCFCLELSEFGIDPSIIARLVRDQWRDWLGNCFAYAASSKESYFCFFSPEIRSSAWRSTGTGLPSIGTPFGFGLRRDLDQRIDDLSSAGSGRLAMFDVHRRAKQIEDALAALNAAGE